MDYVEAFRVWGVVPPAELERLLDVDPSRQLVVGRVRTRVPFPPLRADEIARAFDLAAEWEIPAGMVPIAGDFHRLMCVDFSGLEPAVAIVEDDRRAILRLAPAEFFDALVVHEAPLGATTIRASSVKLRF